MRVSNYCPECSRPLSLYRHFLMMMGSNSVTCNHCHCKFKIWYTDKNYYYLICFLICFNSLFATLNFKNGSLSLGIGFTSLAAISIWLYTFPTITLFKIEGFQDKEGKIFRNIILAFLLTVILLFAIKKAVDKIWSDKPLILIAKPH